MPTLAAADVVALHREGGQTCIQVFFIRHGRNYGNRAYWPGRSANRNPENVMAAFLAQFYENKEVPGIILVSVRPDNHALLIEALAGRRGHGVEISVPRRGGRRALMDHALQNARDALQRRLAESATQRSHLEGLASLLGLDAAPQRIEVYDNSHIQGSQPVGAMIVAGADGFMKNQYRKFTVRKAPAGDDYAMMREVLDRRFSRLVEEDPERNSTAWPDLVLVDGGAGQLSTALAVMEDLGVSGVDVAGVAKGPDRNAGRERIFLAGREPLMPDERDPVLWFIQRLRDEAHRFAIGAHRSKRAGRISHSLLDEIPGIGPMRKRALLHHFGSARAVADAALADLEKVNGIDRTVARRIRDHFQRDP